MLRTREELPSGDTGQKTVGERCPNKLGLPRVGVGTHPDKDREWVNTREGNIHPRERDPINRVYTDPRGAENSKMGLRCQHPNLQGLVGHEGRLGLAGRWSQNHDSLLARLAVLEY